MTESIAKLSCAIAVPALLYGIVWAGWWRGQYTVLAAINAAVALAIMVTFAQHLPAAIRYKETSTLLLFAFEASILLVFALAIFGLRVPRFAILVQAGINLLLAAALAYFLFAFRFTRLI